MPISRTCGHAMRSIYEFILENTVDVSVKVDCIEFFGKMSEVLKDFESIHLILQKLPIAQAENFEFYGWP